jgi:hypothetical protein
VDAQARNRRHLAARAHQPKRIRLLLVNEAPPADPDRYFYFVEGDPDPLFEQVVEVLFEQPAEVGNRSDDLKQLKRRGVFAIELGPEGSGGKLDEQAGWLAIRAQDLQPERVVLIGENVFRAARKALAAAGLPVVESKVREPSAGQEADFRRELRTALVKAGLEPLIRPRPASKVVNETREMGRTRGTSESRRR